VSLSAVLGILAILMRDFGQLALKVLMTTGTISAMSLCGLCCGAVMEIRRKRWLPLLGIALAGLAAVLLIAGIWLEAGVERFWKITATVSVFAIALSHLSLLELARLSPRFAWAMPAAYAVVLTVAGLTSGIFWEVWEGDDVYRLLGVAAVLDAAVTLLIPIFHRLSEDDSEAETRPSLADIDREMAELEARFDELKAMKESALREDSAT